MTNPKPFRPDCMRMGCHSDQTCLQQDSDCVLMSDEMKAKLHEHDGKTGEQLAKEFNSEIPSS